MMSNSQFCELLGFDMGLPLTGMPISRFYCAKCSLGHLDNQTMLSLAFIIGVINPSSGFSPCHEMLLD